MLLRLIINALALYLTAQLLPSIRTKGTFSLIFMALLIAFLNTFIRPLLFILTIPLTIVTFGLFIFIINGLVFFMAASLVDGYEVDNLWSGILGWLFFSLFSVLLNSLFVF